MSAPVESVRGDDDADYRSRLLAGAATRLMEHFDSVVIIATARDVDGGTHLFCAVRGNTYAAIASAECWTNRQKNPPPRHG